MLSSPELVLGNNILPLAIGAGKYGNGSGKRKSEENKLFIK